MEMKRAKSSGQDLRCKIYPLESLKDYKFVVVCSFFRGQLVLSRQKKKDTWETQGGHIEAGETPLESARRELYEESGILNARIIPVCDYYGYDADSHANGMVFAAIVEELGTLPESEMAEVWAFVRMPEALSYPHVTPLLFEESRRKIEEAG